MGSLTNVEKCCAEACELAYSPHDRRMREGPYLQAFNYNYVPSLSDKDLAVFQNRWHVLIAFRGTVITEWVDLYSDAILALTSIRLSPRFRRGLNQVMTCFRFYGPKPFYLITGHSLGGTLADAITRMLVKELPLFKMHGFTFNKGSGILPSECRKVTSKNKRVCNSVTNIRIKGDFVSFLEKNVHKQLPKSDAKASEHSICQFNNTC